MRTDQAKFWESEFGDQYILRNNSPQLLAANLSLFAEIFKSTELVSPKFLEFGANIGMNAQAIKLLFPDSIYSGVEINKNAYSELEKVADHAYLNSFEEFTGEQTYQVTFTKGVLIHLDPSSLDTAYEKLYQYTDKFILIIEYYNPSPVAIEYRGNHDKLFKRDFAGEILAKFPDLHLADYGFVYHQGRFPQDDLTWFLLQKSSN
jgi:spore coat polysaccharide biosynthesis protein SpsF